MSVQDENSHRRVGPILDGTLEAFNSALSNIADADKSPDFCNNPAEYDWEYVNKKEILVPYNCTSMSFHGRQDISEPRYPNPFHIRWEKHNVWIVQGGLRAGESNLLQRRHLYIDVDSWAILFGEGFDASGRFSQCYMLSKSTLSGTSKHGRWYRI